MTAADLHARALTELDLACKATANDLNVTAREHRENARMYLELAQHAGAAEWIKANPHGPIPLRQ